MGVPPQQNVTVAKPEDSPSPDFDSQLSDLANELDSQFSIAKGKTAAPPSNASTLIPVPPHIAALRSQLFTLKTPTPIVWTEAEWNTYFPYISNFWVRNQTRQPTKKLTVAEYWYCRFYRAPDDSASTGQRDKTIRDVPSCNYKMKVVKQLNSEGDIVSLTVGPLHTGQHNHTQDYADRTKINQGVKKPLKAEVEKGYTPADVHRNAQGTHREVNAVALRDAGGSALTLQGVYNAGLEYLRRNRDPRKMGARDDWQVQMDDCYGYLQTLGEEVLSDTISVQRGEEVSRAIVFAHRGEFYLIYPAGIVQN